MLGADVRGVSLNNCKLVGCEISYADNQRMRFHGVRHDGLSAL
jgi:hypothetical protein